MSQDQTSIICIDLKSFYASVECVERGLDPFKANLVVADPTRSKSTICLAITPAMKSLGIKQRRAREVLVKMVENGWLKKEGASRSTIYVKNTEGR